MATHDAGRDFDLAAGCFHPFKRAVRVGGGKGEEQDDDRIAVAALVHQRLGSKDSAEIHAVVP
jgi:hypothetical protein